MMPATKFLFLLLLLGLLSILIWIAHSVLARASANAAVRLRLLKISIIGLWSVPFACILLKPAALRVQFPAIAGAVEDFENTTRAVAIRSAEWALPEIFAGLYFAIVSLLLLRLLRDGLAARRLLAGATPSKWRGQSFYSSAKIGAPLAFGSKIYLPAADLSDRAIEMALAHEGTHVANGDPWWKTFSLLTRAFLFFTPTVYSLHRRFELDMEIECDRITMIQTRASATEYGGLLLDTAAGLPRNSLFAYMSDHQLKRRILAMKTSTKKRPLLTLLLSAVLAGGGYTAIAATNVQSTKKFNVKAEVMVNERVVARPEMMVLENEEGEIEISSSADKLFIRLVAQEGTAGPQEVQLKMAMKYHGREQSFEIKNEMLLESGVWTNILLSSIPHPNVKLRLVASQE